MRNWLRRQRPADRGTGGSSAEAATGTPDLDRVLAERDELVRLCVYALDRARSSGVAERLAEGLAGIGVAALRPDGERFDPSRHEAGGTAPAPDPALEGCIAQTEVPGFTDRDRVLRAPVVTVYQWRS